MILFFYEVKKKKDGIYKYFRNENYEVIIPKTTKKPTGENINQSDFNIKLDKKYKGNWIIIDDSKKYLIIEVSSHF